MKTTLFMAASANGFAARPDGIGEGLNIFSRETPDVHLTLNKVKELSSDIVQLHFSVTRNALTTLYGITKIII